MRRLLFMLGPLVILLSVYYFTSKSKGEYIPDWLTYGLGIVACLFITILFYQAMQYFKKK